MTFFDKKQEVIDIQLTRFGKNLLSRGAFKPVYYQFFDDDIIYNIERAGTTEEQNDSEPRIKDGIRLRTQHTTVGLENSFDQQTELIKAQKRGTFLKLRKKADPLESDKLLKYPLANSKRNSQQAPHFSLKLTESEISGSLAYPNPENKGIFKNSPQITIKPTYKYTVDRTKQIELEDQLITSESFIDLESDVIEFLDGSCIIRDPENIVVDLQELATSYGLDNFEIEFYEETSEGSDQYVLILDEDKINNLFTIKTDESVESVTVSGDKSRNFYSD
tara:strand:+ start:720 stop:1550 length:831 start_codon:yes stop_codon:yes gene_type:complete